MRKITAPFSEDQVDALNQFQLGISWCAPGHPVTCPHRAGSEDNLDDEDAPAGARVTHGAQGGQLGVLVATARGWACAHCDHTQDWAHAFMAQTAPQALSDESFASYAALALRTRGRITDRQALLERIDAAIGAYKELFLYRFALESHSDQQNELIGRARTVAPVMLASLRRRRMALMGVGVSAGELPAADASWTLLSEGKPGDDVLVEVLYHDQKITNPFHDGFGCNAWIESRRFYGGRILPSGGTPTHWRPAERLTL